jgi:hypothetical protein
MHGLAQTGRRSEQGKKAEASDKAGNFGNVFILAVTVDEGRPEHDPFDLMGFGPGLQRALAGGKANRRFPFLAVVRIRLGEAAGRRQHHDPLDTASFEQVEIIRQYPDGSQTNPVGDGFLPFGRKIRKG